jgi:hypothetical protein
LWKRECAKILGEIPSERFANRFPESNATRHECRPHLAVLVDANQHSDLGDETIIIESNRHRLDVQERKAPADSIELFVREPGGVGCAHVAHALIITRRAE